MKTEKKIGIALCVWSLTSGLIIEHYTTSPPTMYLIPSLLWLGACLGAALNLIP